MPKRKTKDEKLQEQLDMLAKYKKNGGVHDRLLGNTSNHNDIDTSIINDDNKSNDTSISTIIDTDEVKDTSINTSEDNDTSIDNSTSIDIDEVNDISKSITIDKDTSNDTDIFNDEDTSTSIDKIKGKNKSTDTSTITSGLPKVETEEKKYVSLYLRESVANRFDKFVRDQVKKQRLKNAKIKSFYGEIAIEEFLKKYGY